MASKFARLTRPRVKQLFNQRVYTEIRSKLNEFRENLTIGRTLFNTARLETTLNEISAIENAPAAAGILFRVRTRTRRARRKIPVSFNRFFRAGSFVIGSGKENTVKFQLQSKRKKRWRSLFRRDGGDDDDDDTSSEKYGIRCTHAIIGQVHFTSSCRIPFAKASPGLFFHRDETPQH